MIPPSSSRLTRGHKWLVIAVSLLLAATGLVWMAGDYAALLRPDWDGPDLRSALHSVVIAHGLLATLGVLLLGTLLGRHIPAGLARKTWPWSGVFGLAVSLLLIASGLALYYAPSPDLHEMAGYAHQAFGLIAIYAVARHIWVWGRRG